MRQPNIHCIDFYDKNAPVKFVEALHKNKFALIKSPLLEKDKINSMYQTWKSFFLSNDKSNYLFDPISQQGYFPPALERAKTAETSDQKEMFQYIPFGKHPAYLGEITYQNYTSLLLMAHTLYTWLDLATPAHIFSKNSVPLSSMLDINFHTLLRILYYPALQPSDSIISRTAEHEDISIITLLPAATMSGLEIINSEGHWMPIEQSEDTVLVIVGDMLEIYSNGYYTSTTHRVIHNDAQLYQQERFSSVLFVHLKPSFQIKENQTVQQLFQARMEQIGLHTNIKY